MKLRMLFLLALFSVLFPSGGSQALLLNDGGIHSTSDGTYAEDTVFVRAVGCNSWVCLNPGAPTEFRLLPGGTVGGFYVAGDEGTEDSIYAKETSSVLMSGGTVTYGIGVFGRGSFTMSGGSTDDLQSFNGSTVNMSGGTVNNGLWPSAMSAVTMSGGTVINGLVAFDTSSIILRGGSVDQIAAVGGTTITIVGSGFSVDDASVGYGLLAATTGQLTGTLDSGDSLNTPFFHNGWGDPSYNATGHIYLSAGPASHLPLSEELVNDGGSSSFDDRSTARTTVFVRNANCGTSPNPRAACSEPGASTNLTLPSSGAIGALYVGDTSSITLSGGAIGNGLIVAGSASLEMSDGYVGWYLKAIDSSSLTISGGFIDSGISASDHSRVVVSGGLIERLYASDSSTITVIGTGFAIGGTPVGNGPITATSGELTGTLLSGEAIECDLYRSGGSIVIVPEPSAVTLQAGALACLAGISACRRRRARAGNPSLHRSE